MARFEAWDDPSDQSITLAKSEDIPGLRERALLSSDAYQLYAFEAATFEEANAIHFLRMGWEPYRPEGPGVPCPDCGATYYPQGSGDCWRCGGLASEQRGGPAVRPAT